MEAVLRVSIYFVSTVFRLVIPFFLWRYPLIVTVGSVFLDTFDVEFFRLAVRSTKGNLYQTLDKGLDFYWYVFAFIYALATPFWLLFSVLFVIRLVGVVVFLLTKERKAFFFFPNIFENFFIFYILVEAFPQFSYLLTFPSILWAGLVVVGLKVFQEYLANIAGFSLHRTIFGVRLQS